MPTLLRYSTIVAVLACVTFATMWALVTFVDVHPREMSVTVLDEPGKASAPNLASAKTRPLRAAHKSVRHAAGRTRTAERAEHERTEQGHGGRERPRR